MKRAPLLLNSLGLTALCLIGLNFAACGKKDTNSPGDLEPALAEGGAATLGTGSSSSTQTARRSYHFNFNDCDTGRQEAIASDPAAATAKLCLMLQDPVVNRGCAESLRHDHFDKLCTGTWSPRFTATTLLPAPAEDPAGINPPPAPFISIPAPTRDPIRPLLQNLTLDSYRLNPALKGREAAAAKQFMEDIKAHGLSPDGPNGATYITDRTTANDGNFPNIYLAILTIPELGFPLLLQFDLDPAGKAPPRLRVAAQKCGSKNGQTLPEFLKDVQCVQEIATAQLKAAATN